ncbi:MAG TPA: hypothetical protein VIK61_13790 [Acidimicrobiia bacterium]
MIHVARRLLGAFVVLAIVAGATLALSSRPRLKTDRTAVERNWQVVRPKLDSRYRLVNALAHSIDATGGPANPIVEEVGTAFASWNALTPTSSVARSITTANTLEGLARRLAATVTGSPLLAADPNVTAALRAVTDFPIPTGVTPLDDAISRYEKDRGGPLRRLVAGPLGFSAIPGLALATGA